MSDAAVVGGSGGTGAGATGGSHFDAGRGPGPVSDAGSVLDADVGDAGDAGVIDETGLEFRYTEYVGKLTGTTLNSTAAVGMTGTDLGVAFARDGMVALLFGDAWADDRDSLATASTDFPTDGSPPDITWVTTSGSFTPFVVTGVDLGGFNVPVDAVPAGDTTYYFFSTGYDPAPSVSRHSHSVLAHGSQLDITPLTLDHEVESDKFINVSVVVEDDTAWIFGSGPYRKSPVYLAQVALAEIADRTAWRYWPDFGAGEATAEPIVTMAQPCVGELSVRKHPLANLWLMTTCGAPRGVHLRTAEEPTGPWSAPQIIYTPEFGDQHFVHAQESAIGFDDGLSDRDREEEVGGEYGAYMVPEWFASPATGVYDIVYLLSSWNPYQVHVVRSVFSHPGVEVTQPTPGAGLPPATLTNPDFMDNCTTGWTATGDPFACNMDGTRWRLTTHAVDGDATIGTLAQSFEVDAETNELRFFIHGGDGQVLLMDGDEVVRRSHGRQDNDVELEVRWQLRDLRGRTVRIVIEDNLSGPWGFVGVRSFELR